MKLEHLLPFDLPRVRRENGLLARNVVNSELSNDVWPNVESLLLSILLWQGLVWFVEYLWVIFVRVLDRLCLALSTRASSSPLIAGEFLALFGLVGLGQSATAALALTWRWLISAIGRLLVYSQTRRSPLWFIWWSGLLLLALWIWWGAAPAHLLWNSIKNYIIC